METAKTLDRFYSTLFQESMLCFPILYCNIITRELLTAQSFNESLGVPRGSKSHRKHSATATPQSVFNLHRRILIKQENKRYDGETYDDKMLVTMLLIRTLG